MCRCVWLFQKQKWLINVQKSWTKHTHSCRWSGRRVTEVEAKCEAQRVKGRRKERLLTDQANDILFTKPSSAYVNPVYVCVLCVSERDSRLWRHTYSSPSTHLSIYRCMTLISPSSFPSSPSGCCSQEKRLKIRNTNEDSQWKLSPASWCLCLINWRNTKHSYASQALVNPHSTTDTLGKECMQRITAKERKRVTYFLETWERVASWQ